MNVTSSILLFQEKWDYVVVTEMSDNPEKFASYLLKQAFITNIEVQSEIRRTYLWVQYCNQTRKKFGLMSSLFKSSTVSED